MDIDPTALIATRHTLHALAEHVLMADLHHHTGRIGLRAAPGGLATPVYQVGGGARRLLVTGSEVRAELDGTVVAGAPITTLATARSALGVEAAAPTDVYDLATDGDDRPLPIDVDAMAAMAAMFAAGDTALRSLRAEADAERERGDGEITTVQLWPEHLDLACTIDEVNFGASPGDDGHDAPYLYVGPWALPPPAHEPWNEPFGASRPALPPPSAIEALGWFRSARAVVP